MSLNLSTARKAFGAPKAARLAGERSSSALPWQRFLAAAVGLCLALFLALYASAAGEQGEFRVASALAVAALILAGYIALRAVPFLARQVARNRRKLQIEYEITREGLIYLFVTFVIAVAALNTGNNLLFLILAIMLAAVLGSGILSRVVLSRIDLDLSLPPHVFAQQPFICRLRLRNHKRILPSYSLTVAPAAAARSKARRPSGSAADTTRRILGQPVYVPYLPKASVLEQEVELRFSERGRFTQGGFTLSSKFPFGFVRKKRTIDICRELLVLPEIAPIEAFRAIPPALAGEIESLSRDDRGHDLHGLRDYRPSDSARTIDWKATARAQRLKVREFSREDDEHIRLILDNRLPSLSAANLEKFERAIKLCASLAWHLAARGAHLDFGAAGIEVAAIRNHESVYPVLEALATVEPTTSSDPVAETHFPNSSAWNVVFTSRPASFAAAAGETRCTVVPFDEL